MTNVKEFGRVGVLMGGVSSERTISLKSGRAVFEALKEEGYDVVAIDIAASDPRLIAAQLRASGIQVAFIALHGRLGEDGTIQTILEELNIPYTGSSAKASALAFDKAQTQKILLEKGISVPPYVVFSNNKLLSYKDVCNVLKSSGVVVKPSCEGSSIGITIAHRADEWNKAVALAFQYGDDIIVEKWIKGRELTVGLLDQDALPVIEICPKRTYFDFTAKYESGLTEYIIPAKLSAEKTLEVQKMALDVFRCLGCSQLARVDFMLDEAQKFYVLEINTIPGFTATSLLPKAAKYIGLNFNQLCVKILSLVYARKEKRESAVRF